MINLSLKNFSQQFSISLDMKSKLEELLERQRSKIAAAGAKKGFGVTIHSLPVGWK
jgi:hypothetical protein